MKNFWKTVERHEKPVALCLAIFALVMLATAPFAPVDRVVVDPVVEIQQEATGFGVDEWNLFVVQNGDCYSIGDDEGWVAYNECMTHNEAKLKAARLKAAHKRRIAAEKETWIKVD